MSNVDPWQFDLEGYLRETEPDAAERADAWQTGIGLQAVDGLPVSDYLLGTAKEHIEGNTRTTAVFAIKYLRTMGYEVNNDPYRDHSWYFRNALVCANYEHVSQGVAPTTVYLERFFQNQLCGTQHELKNRYLHLDWPQQDTDQATQQVTQQDTDQVTDQVRALLAALGDAELSARELMDRLGLSHRPTFRQNYLNPALAAGLIERTIPNKPTSRPQRYRKARR